jgi:hypothetical protein
MDEFTKAVLEGDDAERRREGFEDRLTRWRRLARERQGRRDDVDNIHVNSDPPAFAPKHG